jgi:hypothetical protein
MTQWYQRTDASERGGSQGEMFTARKSPQQLKKFQTFSGI